MRLIALAKSSFSRLRPSVLLRGIAMLLAVMLLAGLPAPSVAQDVDEEAASETTDPTRRLVIRFVTEADFPPFNFYDEDGVLVGFNVDVARAICLELNTACDITVRKWGELLLALKRG